MSKKKWAVLLAVVAIAGLAYWWYLSEKKRRARAAAAAAAGLTSANGGAPGLTGPLDALNWMNQVGATNGGDAEPTNADGLPAGTEETDVYGPRLPDGSLYQ